jgi:hypothetical protein
MDVGFFIAAATLPDDDKVERQLMSLDRREASGGLLSGTPKEQQPPIIDQHHRRMKQRITYLAQKPENVQPSNIQVTKESLAVQSLDGAKEHHVTLSLTELPRNVRATRMQG